MKLRFAIYCRVSTQDQNLDNQKNLLIKHANRMGWSFEVFEEKQSTRKTRPVQNDLYCKLLKKEFDGLLIYKFDRWARSTTELVNHIEHLNQRRVRVISYTENIDLDNSMGKAMLTVISAFAQLERDIITERTLAGLDRAKKQGKTLGRPKGSKDKKDRKKSGYYLRHSGK